MAYGDAARWLAPRARQRSTHLLVPGLPGPSGLVETACGRRGWLNEENSAIAQHESYGVTQHIVTTQPGACTCAACRRRKPAAFKEESNARPPR